MLWFGVSGEDNVWLRIRWFYEARMLWFGVSGSSYIKFISFDAGIIKDPIQILVDLAFPEFPCSFMNTRLYKLASCFGAKSQLIY